MTRSDASPDPPVVTLDLWHTLIVSDPASRARVARARDAGWAVPLTRAGLAPDAALAAAIAMRRAAERIQSTGRSVPLRSQSALLRKATGISIPPGGPARTIGGEVLRSTVRRAPGALGAIEELAASGRRLALVSNILSEPAAAMWTLLRRTRLLPRFDTVYLSTEHRFAKPSPEPFLTVLRTLGVAPSEAVHIGDHSDDVVGALSAGVPVIRYTGLLDRYPPESADSLARIPRRVPTFSDWRTLAAAWPTLLRSARAALAQARA